MNTDKKPLGYITLLNNTKKAIYPLDDFFINYVFYKKENWNHLRDLINIFLHTYAEKYGRQDGFHLVSENVVVETQYEHYLKGSSMPPTQDIKVDEEGSDSQTYIEFQNRAFSKPPIEVRASNYSGLAINKANDNTKVSQIWLLAENYENVLCGQAISNFRMKEENTGEYYPRDINIMFISLPRLAEEDSLCGKLSKLLMGTIVEDELSGELMPIAKMFKREFEVFKENEGMVQSMTVLEERYEEGIAIGSALANQRYEEGIAVGEAIGSALADQRYEEGIATGEAIGSALAKQKIVKNMLKRGMPIDEIVEDTGMTREEVEALFYELKL